jgi:hypothetical protein
MNDGKDGKDNRTLEFGPVQDAPKQLELKPEFSEVMEMFCEMKDGQFRDVSIEGRNVTRLETAIHSKATVCGFQVKTRKVKSAGAIRVTMVGVKKRLPGNKKAKAPLVVWNGLHGHRSRWIEASKMPGNGKRPLLANAWRVAVKK